MENMRMENGKWKMSNENTRTRSVITPPTRCASLRRCVKKLFASLREKLFASLRETKENSLQLNPVKIIL